MANTEKAKSWFRRFRVAFTLTGGPPVVEDSPLAASQTILEGDPLTISSGDISEATALSGAIYGVAAETATTTAADEGTEIGVYVADRVNIFVGQANAASSGINDGSECDIVVSSNVWRLNIGASTKGVALVVGHVTGDDTSDSTDYGRLHFVWKRSQWDALVAAK